MTPANHAGRQLAVAQPGCLYIDGVWVPPSQPGTISVVSPVDGTTVAQVARASSADVVRAVEAARRAFDDGPWPRSAPAAGIAVLERLLAELERRRDEIACYWTLQIGALARTAPAIVAGGRSSRASGAKAGRTRRRPTPRPRSS